MSIFIWFELASLTIHMCIFVTWMEKQCSNTTFVTLQHCALGKFLFFPAMFSPYKVVFIPEEPPEDAGW